MKTKLVITMIALAIVFTALPTMAAGERVIKLSGPPYGYSFELLLKDDGRASLRVPYEPYKKLKPKSRAQAVSRAKDAMRAKIVQLTKGADKVTIKDNVRTIFLKGHVKICDPQIEGDYLVADIGSYRYERERPITDR